MSEPPAMRPAVAPPRGPDELFQRFVQTKAELEKMSDEIAMMNERRDKKAHELLELLQEVKAVSADADKKINKVIGHLPTVSPSEYD